MKSSLIAPCGMNCATCMGYQREKNKCLGCREMSKSKPESCRKCAIARCKVLKEKGLFCCSDECEKFPCQRLKNLDKVYRTKYAMSMLENLENIKKNGIKKFVKAEEKRWQCPKCKGLVCVHSGYCLRCSPQNK